MSDMLLRTGLLSFAVAGLITGAASWCQSYPGKPIRLIVAGPAGGGADVIARPLAQKVSESLGQQVIVDNRPGAGTLISGQVTAAAQPDGYTVLLATVSTICISPLLARKRPYDPIQDFVPITLVATAPLMVAVHPSLPARTTKELIGLAKARPKQLFYASNGLGSLSHLTTELFSRAAGVVMVHVPYKGGTPAAVDTVAGHTQVVITAVPTLIAHVRSARLRALAVTSSQRSAALPELPTVAESALPGFDAMQWFAVFAPKNTAPAIVEKLYAELRKAADHPSVKAPLAQEGAELAVTGPQALSRQVHADVTKWQKVIRESNIALE